MRRFYTAYGDILEQEVSEEGIVLRDRFWVNSRWPQSLPQSWNNEIGCKLVTVSDAFNSIRFCQAKKRIKKFGGEYRE